MIYDCFTFFNELDLLEIRLNVLKDVVDRFVLVESPVTFANKPKPLYFSDNKSRFADFSGRIIHVVVKDFPPYTKGWDYEAFQRNGIGRGLADAKPDDVIMISDIDEIPNPRKIRGNVTVDGITAFRQAYYAFYLNYLNVRQRRWVGTRMLTYRNFLGIFDGVKVRYNEFVNPALNAGTTPHKIRMCRLPRRCGMTRIVKNGGWHFTCLGGAQAVLVKLSSYSHQEHDPERRHLDEGKVEALIAAGKSPGFKMDCFAVELDEAFPKYILDNRERYSGLIYAITPEYVRSVRLSRLFRTVQGWLIAWAEWLMPSRVHQWLHEIRIFLNRSQFTHLKTMRHDERIDG